MTLFKRMNKLLSTSAGVELRRVRSPSQSVWHALLNLRDWPSQGAEDAAFLAFCRDNFMESKAQLFQDLFVLNEFDCKRSGFFVEFGATDGVTLSNTYLLETSYGWNGILAEPARGWHAALASNRSAVIDKRCVTGSSGASVWFNETEWRELSTIDTFSTRDHHAVARKGGTRYQVASISLNDLLETHGAPHQIDYLSVDTEGSELEILTALDFSRYSPAVITVEHNFVMTARTRIHDLLAGEGYQRKFEQYSLFDDWYVLPVEKR